ncbi:hypothetical protein CAEBREN_12358 [Caenorhabditis brenneri]|uniref:DUF4440 domain-containing protein n=1 Tax=Caenorhabditis brenneri TaxID=135651 RepID=G0NN71_CAEBE|nr:hypothetical protein CAEBREN_12358 [Caenorhabditis brenneri]
MASLTAQQAEATLKPSFLKYMQAFDSLDWTTAESFFHQDAVLVLKGKEATYGSKAIVESMSKFSETSGKMVSTMSDLKYEGTQDFLIVGGSIVSDTEKIGSVKGKFFQIWKKEGDRHLILHDHFEMITP